MTTPTEIGATPTDTSIHALRLFIYLRVSTLKQSEVQLSIPDQRRQLEAWTTAGGHKIVAEFIESVSATDDRRPEFQRMIDRACDSSRSVDAIVVHSYSRFFREAFEQELYIRKLNKHGVRLISITQPIGDDTDPVQAMMRKVIALFDEYQSKENAKHVLRSMGENARQGFWNGSRPPFDYAAVEVDRRGARIKKKLAVDLVEAEVVIRAFTLVQEGHNGSGPKGVKATRRGSMSMVFARAPELTGASVRCTSC